MNKKFDCIKMKNEIQEKILKEKENYTEEKWHEIQQERILKNPILRPLLKKFLDEKKKRTA